MKKLEEVRPSEGATLLSRVNQTGPAGLSLVAPGPQPNYVANKDIGKLQLVQKRAAHIALRCKWSVNVNNSHVN